jgi:dipeptidyl aminopeptidase/acylaminoacyl peptidase
MVFSSWAIDAHRAPPFCEPNWAPKAKLNSTKYDPTRRNGPSLLRYQTAWDESAGIAHIPRKGKAVYLLTNKGTDKIRLVLWDPTKGTEKLIHQDPLDRVDIADVEFDPKTDSLLYVAYAEDEPRRYFFSKAWEERYKRWTEKLPGYQVSVQDYSYDERYFILRAWHDREPGHYYLWDDRNPTSDRLGAE